MIVIVIGADGYLGRTTCRELSKRHEVIAVDNYAKISLMKETKRKPLWEGRPLDNVFNYDACDDDFSHLIGDYQPDAIIDYAEIPSAPYSMISKNEVYRTIDNNLFGTINLVQSVKDYSPHTHIIKLGTMGEYGTPNIDIEEGWINITHNGRTDRMVFPKNPGSLYHLSKVFDSDLLNFYSRIYDLKVTDLNQGFVYGADEGSRFCYDDIWGTALNRFIVQLVAGRGLTVYGKGNQTRGVININDTIKCVELAMNNPAMKGEFRVFNQFTEQYSLNELAEKVCQAGHNLGYDCSIDHIPNPRKELENHYYNAKHTHLSDLGLNPELLTNEVLTDMIRKVEKHKANIDMSQIDPTIKW